MSERNLPDEHLIKAALEARASTATVAPDAWQRLEGARRQAPRRLRVVPTFPGRAPLLAMAAAAAAVLLIAVLTITGADTASRLDMMGDDSKRTEPDRVVTDPDESAPPGTTPGTAPGTTAPPPAVADAGLDDLRNATYPSDLCPSDLKMPGQTFRLTEGEATELPAGEIGGTGVKLLQSAVGDLDGDGRTEAVARFGCFTRNSDHIVRFIAVLGEGDTSVRVVHRRTDSGTKPTAELAYVADDRTEDVRVSTVSLIELADDLTLVDGRGVRVVWQQQDGDVGSPVGYFEQAVTYRWNGRELVSESVGERRKIAKGTEPPVEHYAIRRSGVRTMTLPLANAGRDSRTRLCADVFSPEATLADVRLAGSRATVPGAGGPGQDGLVVFGEIRYRSFPEEAPEVALVEVSCEIGTVKKVRLAVVGLVDGRPTVLDVVLPQNPERTMLGYPRFEGQQLIVTWLTNEPVQAVEHIYYHWDGNHFVLL